MTITHIHRYLSGEADAAEKKAFEDWLAAHEDNRAQFEDYRKIYGVSIERTQKFDAVSALETFRKNRAAQPSAPATNPETAKVPPIRPAARSRSASGLWLRVAAVLLVAAGIAVYALYPTFLDEPIEAALDIQGTWYETAYGEQRAYRLPDGSRIRLNADSRLFLPDTYGQTVREITLLGEGFFEVEPDPALPFVVSTAEATVEVLGTSFGVRARPEQAISYIAVQSGRVSVQSVGITAEEEMQRVELGAGEFTLVAFGMQPETPRTSGTDAFLSWTQQQFVFRDTPLSEVLAQLERHFNVYITLSDSSRAGEPVTARYAAESLDEILNITSLTHGVGFEVSSRKSNP